MSQSEISFIIERIKILSNSIDYAEKNITALKLDYQGVLKSNPKIRPGIGCKVVYDANGLIVDNKTIEIDDLPEIPINKINGLRKLLDDKLDSGSLRDVQSKLDQLTNRKTITPGTGIKINYDENGVILSSSELLENDIPELDISKIRGLSNKLSILESLESNDTLELPKPDPISPGTFTKITYNSDGRVVLGTNLTIDDIPISIINRIGFLENKMSTTASQESLNAVQDDIRRKLYTNPPITAGTFTKVKVDINGLITEGFKLTINDLPMITIQNIQDLESTLRSKTEQSDFIELLNTVTSLVERPAFDTVNIINQLKNKAGEEEVRVLSNQVDSMNKKLDNISKVPLDQLSGEIKQLKEMVSNILGRMFILEGKISLLENSNRSEEYEEGQ